MSARPRCPYCDRLLPKQTRTVWLHTERQVGTSDEIFRYLIVEQYPTTIAECRKLSNRHVVSVSKWVDGKIRRFGEWDGESYRGAPHPFCTGTCAQAFAVAAHKAGYRMKRLERVEG